MKAAFGSWTLNEISEANRARVRDLTPNRRRGETVRDVRRNVQEVDVCVSWLHLVVRNIITCVTWWLENIITSVTWWLEI